MEPNSNENRSRDRPESLSDEQRAWSSSVPQFSNDIPSSSVPGIKAQKPSKTTVRASETEKPKKKKKRPKAKDKPPKKRHADDVEGSISGSPKAKNDNSKGLIETDIEVARLCDRTVTAQVQLGFERDGLGLQWTRALETQTALIELLGPLLGTGLGAQFDHARSLYEKVLDANVELRQAEKSYEEKDTAVSALEFELGQRLKALHARLYGDTPVVTISDSLLSPPPDPAAGHDHSHGGHDTPPLLLEFLRQADEVNFLADRIADLEIEQGKEAVLRESQRALDQPVVPSATEFLVSYDKRRAELLSKHQQARENAERLRHECIEQGLYSEATVVTSEVFSFDTVYSGYGGSNRTEKRPVLTPVSVDKLSASFNLAYSGPWRIQVPGVTALQRINSWLKSISGFGSPGPISDTYVEVEPEISELPTSSPEKPSEKLPEPNRAPSGRIWNAEVIKRRWSEPLLSRTSMAHPPDANRGGESESEPYEH